MRIAKPMLLIATPVGVIGGVYEAFRLAGGLAFLMIRLYSDDRRGDRNARHDDPQRTAGGRACAD